MNVDLERKVIQMFIIKDKRSRYLQFVSSAKTRPKLIDRLCHFRDFRSELFDEVYGDAAAFIKHRLEHIKGDKSRCYVISDNLSTDQQELPVEVALQATIGYCSAILVFGDAEMVYYEGEPPNNRLLSRHQ